MKMEKSDRSNDNQKTIVLREATILQAVINAVPTPIFFKDAEGLYLGCNDAFEQFVGRTRSEIVGNGVFDLWDPSLAERYNKADAALYASGAAQNYEAQVIYADGSTHDVIFHKAVFWAEEEGISGIVGAILDITDRKKAEAALLHSATHDSLTGLASRALSKDLIAQSVALSKRNNDLSAVMFVDLDGFKSVNDNMGHEAGDELLVKVAQTITSCVRAVDNVCRLGGDEFLIILSGANSRIGIETVAKKVIVGLSSPFRLSNGEASIGASIGIAICPDNSDLPEELIQKADAAMYQVKARGKGSYQFAE